MKILVLSAFLSVLLGADHCAGGETRVFPGAGVSAALAVTDGGKIAAKGTGAGDIRVEITDNDPEKCAVTAGIEGGRLVLKAEELPRPIWKKIKELYGKIRGNGKAMDCRAGFNMKLPSSVALELRSGTGEVDVDSFGADVRIESGVGGITIRDLSGSVNIVNGTGSLSGSSCARDMAIEIGVGGAELGGLCGPLTAEIGTGGLDLTWRRTPENGRIEVESGLGPVRLAFPEGARLAPDIDNDDEPVTNDFGAGTGLPVRVKSGGGRVSLVRSSAK